MVGAHIIGPNAGQQGSINPGADWSARAAQVDALDPLSRRVLSFASVLGRSFRRTMLAELLDREGLILDPATVDQLDRFIEADLARVLSC